ncbi:uncharacterized protein L969DRAFT_48622 [Mixia osmundae IAM 14324]|uniref:ATP synthase subunit gamma, mitochondrial n=1 Tax=Mixia osmundae (strain CBS 9802 / IAM 14324 / JCM 22182 / KY 12970) TaxID=764103 RepID=G7DVJ5_MIXOS|nr:uncharacterized protein L969DRAFT_48622 [Mixia osmundae IAM 14324]KEI39554.1 hypothetical protein L969DRAFT_48622 [Mixia osmundae IAM 14324]GAA94605.1 hypothetical protein E5Q_01257 [Mixia osmundae IAM 14324]
MALSMASGRMSSRTGLKQLNAAVQARHFSSTPVPAATLRELEGRLKSVRNIEKITKSMKMIATTRLNKATNAMKTAKGYGAANAVLFDEAEAKTDKKLKTLWIVVSSDRGLCGGIHSSVSKRAKKEIQADGSEGEANVVILGDKPKAQIVRAYPQNLVITFNQIGKTIPTFSDATSIVALIEDSKVEYEKVNLIYNKFVSAIAYESDIIEVYNAETLAASPKFAAYEIEDEGMQNDLASFALANAVYQALVEGHAAEITARRNAMDNASKNATEMIGKLQMQFNRMRQSVITNGQSLAPTPACLELILLAHRSRRYRHGCQRSRIKAFCSLDLFSECIPHVFEQKHDKTPIRLEQQRSWLITSLSYRIQPTHTHAHETALVKPARACRHGGTSGETRFVPASVACQHGKRHPSRQRGLSGTRSFAQNGYLSPHEWSSGYADLPPWNDGEIPTTPKTPTSRSAHQSSTLMESPVVPQLLGRETFTNKAKVLSYKHQLSPTKEQLGASPISPRHGRRQASSSAQPLDALDVEALYSTYAAINTTDTSERGRRPFSTSLQPGLSLEPSIRPLDGSASTSSFAHYNAMPLLAIGTPRTPRTRQSSGVPSPLPLDTMSFPDPPKRIESPEPMPINFDADDDTSSSTDDEDFQETQTGLAVNDDEGDDNEHEEQNPDEEGQQAQWHALEAPITRWRTEVGDEDEDDEGEPTESVRWSSGSISRSHLPTRFLVNPTRQPDDNFISFSTLPSVSEEEPASFVSGSIPLDAYEDDALHVEERAHERAKVSRPSMLSISDILQRALELGKSMSPTDPSPVFALKATEEQPPSTPLRRTDSQTSSASKQLASARSSIALSSSMSSSFRWSDLSLSTNHTSPSSTASHDDAGDHYSSPLAKYNNQTRRESLSTISSALSSATSSRSSDSAKRQSTHQQQQTSTTTTTMPPRVLPRVSSIAGLRGSAMKQQKAKDTTFQDWDDYLDVLQREGKELAPRQSTSSGATSSLRPESRASLTSGKTHMLSFWGGRRSPNSLASSTRSGLDDRPLSGSSGKSPSRPASGLKTHSNLRKVTSNLSMVSKSSSVDAPVIPLRGGSLKKSASAKGKMKAIM